MPTMEGTNELSPGDMNELTEFVKAEQQKTQMQSTVHQLTDICFSKCITSKISSGKLDKYEEPCMQNCVDRWIDTNTIIIKSLEHMRQ